MELGTLQELAANFVDLCSERAAKNLKSCSKEIYTFVQLVTPTAETVRDLERKVEHDFARVEAREGHCNDGGLCITEVTMKFNGENQRKMNWKDKHNILRPSQLCKVRRHEKAMRDARLF